MNITIYKYFLSISFELEYVNSMYVENDKMYTSLNDIQAPHQISQRSSHQKIVLPDLTLQPSSNTPNARQF